MNVYDFDDHLKFLQSWIASQPKRGFGISKKFAEAAGVSTVLMSQILNGSRELSLEQAIKMSQYMQLSELEQKLFLALVNRGRAGNVELKKFYENEIHKIKSEAMEIRSRVPKDINLTKEAQAEFYSLWYFSAIRLITSIDGFQTPEAIAEHLNLPRPEVIRALDFLTQHHLCLYEKGKYKMGPKRTHLESTSPYVVTRQIQWRIKGFEKMGHREAEDLFYTAPLTISRKDREKVRKLFLNLVQELTQLVKDSGSEELICVNFDIFKVN